MAGSNPQDNQEELKQNVQTAAMLAVPAVLIGGGVAWSAISAASKKTREQMGMPPSGTGFLSRRMVNLAKATFSFPVNVARGALGDRYARGDVANYTVLSNPSDREAWSKATSAFSDLTDASGDYSSALKMERATKKIALKKSKGISEKYGSPVTHLEKDGEDTLFHLADKRVINSPGQTSHSVAYFDAAEKVATLKTAAEAKATTLGESIHGLPFEKMLDPISLSRGLRGWLSNPSQAGILRSGMKLPVGFGAAFEPALATSAGGLSTLVGTTLGRGIATAVTRGPGYALGIGVDLLKGSAKDFGLAEKGVGWAKSSKIIRAARFLAFAKGMLPLAGDAYRNSLASEDTYEGNPMLTGIANTASRRNHPGAFIDGYMGESDSAYVPGMHPGSTPTRSAHNESEKRFIQSAAGLSFALHRIAGRAI